MKLTTAKLNLIIVLLLIYLRLASTSFAQSTGVDIQQAYPFGGLTSFGQLVSMFLIPIFEIAAAGVVIYFLYGGFKYLTSRGDKEAVAQAQAMISQAVIAFVILMFSFLILRFIILRLFNINIPLL